MNTKNQKIFDAAIKEANANQDEVIKDAFKACTSDYELQKAYKVLVDGLTLSAATVTNKFLEMGGQHEKLDTVGLKWFDERIETLNTLFADAGQRFATVH